MIIFYRKVEERSFFEMFTSYTRFISNSLRLLIALKNVTTRIPLSVGFWWRQSSSFLYTVTIFFQWLEPALTTCLVWNGCDTAMQRYQIRGLPITPQSADHWNTNVWYCVTPDFVSWNLCIDTRIAMVLTVSGLLWQYWESATKKWVHNRHSTRINIYFIALGINKLFWHWDVGENHVRNSLKPY